jgi:hypothetical protein
MRYTNPRLNGQVSVLVRSMCEAGERTLVFVYTGWVQCSERLLRAYNVGMDANLAYRLAWLLTGRGGTGGAHGAHICMGMTLALHTTVMAGAKPKVTHENGDDSQAESAEEGSDEEGEAVT